MPRLVIFGCSFSYGDGLPDCYMPDIRPGQHPSKYVWGEILGKELGLKTINLSRPGASNMTILFNILNYKFLPDDVVIVQWTFADRDLLFVSENENQDVGPWVNLHKIKCYYEAHSDNDMVIRSMIKIHHSDLYIKNTVKNIVHFSLDHDILYRFIVNKKPDWFNVEVKPINFHTLLIDKGLDNLHPGPKSQQIIADYVKGKI